MNDFFNINKPVGISSNTALSIFKRKTGIKKCGFAGTLDPFASGVLPVAINKATKQIETVVASDKEYECIAKFGISTDTGDIEGKSIAVSTKIPTIDELRYAIQKQFLGIIMQSPSVYSAIKINGKRLCDIAREGELTLDKLQEIADSRAKNIEIFSFEIIEKIGDDCFRFIINSGKGTYIRQLITDLARSVGSEAHLIELARNRVGQFNIKDSINLDDLTLMVNIK